ncbi:uncharacterized protein LOC122848779 isoform X1 [Aphidius gifuensis]|uniref:uncharacterized protein LOC122848779 isoform X1 n=1 Tax=Aphidius gifuensis TaxID=684658 RepID=UPI001CDB9D49|nr:uncharacterized protein LOC122848779 isoform X1 [Aphidius gifuensis]
MYENWSIKMDTQGGISRNAGPGLYEFLMEAELQQYYAGIRGDLKVQTTAQLKYVTEDDLTTIGMSKPEMRRLKKYFQKHFPQNYLLKFKKMLLSKREGCDQIGGLSILAEEKQDKPPIKVPNKHMIPADAIIVNKELGTGEFGVVQQGVWTNDGERIQVAIKCLSRERMQNNPIEFLKEAAIMHAIDHEHIVRLYGVVLDTNSLMLVTELAPLRSLLECLKEPSLRASFPVLSLCDFSIQISDGMQYLEAKRLIHRDLAARNILVFSKNKVKISDFGLSRALGVGKDYYQTNFNVNLKLPIAWCAPECISYLKFTSASDVWAYGVTLWEMFSYGFQPWAALTGHQILEAIDEPNYQRLEQPDCCPNDYFLLMQQCWQHEPTKRPKFHELINLLPDLKPEQVQAVQDSSEIGQLSYRQSDIITVLDKGGNNILWKGVLTNGKTGLFNPAHTIAYLGSNLPSNKPGEFTRGDGKNVFSSSQRKKIRTDMISSPQGDLKHTGHVGLDGAYFGDISFLGGKYPHLPRQVVTPYKPHEDVTDNSSQIYSQDERNAEASSCTNKDSRNSHGFQDVSIDGLWSDTTSELSFTSTNHNKINKKNHQHDSIIMPNCASAIEALGADHEYHEISDEENQDSPLRFDKPLNFDFGPSLLDEMDQMFRSLGSSPQPPPPPPPPSSLSGHHSSAEHESSNARNELREIQAKQSNKKKQASVSPTNVKPISAADQKTLYSAIAMAQELTARSMSDLDHPPDSPRTPASPTRRRKFSFKLPHQHSPKPDRRHFSEEAASIPDIQWLCSSLQSLSSTVSSIESLGAPSTLKLPLWDKASAEFCFAKSRELLTKPSAWTSYMDMEFDTRIINDNDSIKKSLVKSTEFLDNGNRNGSINNFGNGDVLIEKNNTQTNGNGKISYLSNSNLEMSKDAKRVSTSYIDRYFDQTKYYDDDTNIEECFEREIYGFEEEKNHLKNSNNNLDNNERINYWTNHFSTRHDTFGKNKMLNNQDIMRKNNIKTNDNNYQFENMSNYQIPYVKAKSFDLSTDGIMNFDVGTRPKVPGSIKFNLSRDEVEKRIEIQKAREAAYHAENVKARNYRAAAASSSAVATTSSTVASSSSSSTTTSTIATASSFDSTTRANLDTVRIKIQSYRKIEDNKNGHDNNYPFLISNNPLFISETDKQESPLYSSSESLRVNFQRLRRKSDAEIGNGSSDLSSKIFAEKYHREVSGLESVKNYLDAKKGQRFNLGLGKLTQNMIQLGKNIAQNSRNLESPNAKSKVSNMRNLDDITSSSIMRDINFIEPQLLKQDSQIKKTSNNNFLLDSKNRNGHSSNGHNDNSSASPIKTNNQQQQQQQQLNILDPPKLYQNDTSKNDYGKPEIIVDTITTNTNIYRHRTGSLSETKRPVIKNIRRSFHPGAESSEDSDSISHSETDIRARLRFKKRSKKVPQSLRLNLNKNNNNNNKSMFLHPETARGCSIIDHTGKSPPPSTSFLNSLSPPFSSRNNMLSWPESAPSSSLTFTSNSELDSDTSSAEYPEFTQDALTFPPSPAP